VIYKLFQDPVTGFGTIDYPKFYDVMFDIESNKYQYQGLDMTIVYSALFPILGVFLLGGFGYIVYTQYLHPQEDRYTPLP
jgi:nitrate reductase NapE component